jgi:flagellar M-ring protein FliF
MSYLRQVWQEMNPPSADAKPGEPPKTPSQGDLDKIRLQETERILAYVLPLIPDEGTADKKELVKVEAFHDIASPPIPESAMSEKALSWLGESWKTLGLLLLVLVSLVMLRSMIRAAPSLSENKTPSMVTQKEAEPQRRQVQESPPTPRLKRFHSGTSLKDEVALLVSEDPDAAANILRTWIGHQS